MNERLKTVIQWSCYIGIAGYVIFILACLIIITIAPTLFPNVDVSGFREVITTAGMVLSFLSVGIGVFSIYQANISSKQTEKIVNSINVLKHQQESLVVILNSTKEGNIDTTSRMFLNSLCK